MLYPDYIKNMEIVKEMPVTSGEDLSDWHLSVADEMWAEYSRTLDTSNPADFHQMIAHHRQMAIAEALIQVRIIMLRAGL